MVDRPTSTFFSRFLALSSLLAASTRACPAPHHWNASHAPPAPRSRPIYRVLVVFGTRPELIKLWPVMEAARGRDDLELAALNTGQHSDLVTPLLAAFGVHPAVTHTRSPDASLAAFVAATMQRVDAALVDLAPAAVLVQGDTASAYAAATAAFHRGVPVAHVEAGLRSYHAGKPFPEEFYRRSITITASLHFAPTAAAAAALAREGVPHSRVHVTGNTVVDALRLVTANCNGDPLHLQPAGSAEPTVLLHRTPRLLRDGRHVVLWTSHRREAARTEFAGVVAALRSLSLLFPNALFLVPLHSSRVVRLAYAALAGRPNVRLLAPPPYRTFARLLRRITLVATDSGGLMEESVALGLPTVVLRDRTERGEGMACGAAVLAGTAAEQVTDTVAELLASPEAYAARYGKDSPFGDGHAAERIIASLIEHGRRPSPLQGAASDALHFHAPQVGDPSCQRDERCVVGTEPWR